MPKDVRVTNNQRGNPAERELWPKMEAVKDLKDPPSAKSRPQSLTEHTKSQIGKTPLGRDSAGVAMEAPPFDQYVVKAHGSGRLTRRIRKCLWAYVPAFEEEELRPPYNQDTDVARGLRFLHSRDVDCGMDSAWGARDHTNQSADSNAGQGGGPADSGREAQDANPPDGQHGSHGAEQGNSLGEGDLRTGQAETSPNLATGGQRRLTHSGRGKTPWPKDHAT